MTVNNRPVLPTVTNPTNLAAVDVNAISPADVQKFFNNFFDYPISVGAAVNDSIVAHFEKITDNRDSARALASAVIYTAIKQNVEPMAALDQFKNLPPGELSTYTALFLNSERVGTSYLGISNVPVVNKYIQRTILF